MSIFKRFGRGVVWCTKRGWKPLLVLVLLLAVAHSIATLVLGRRVEGELQRIKAEGDPVTGGDLVARGIPDSENGAVVYERVIKAMSARDVADDLLVVENWPAGYPGNDHPSPKRLRQALVRLRPMNDLIVEAAYLPKCRFDMRWDKGFEAPFPQFARMRSMARLMNRAALTSAEDGRMDEAVRYASAGLRLSESMREEPSLISSLVRIAMLKISTGTVIQLATHHSLTPRQAHALYDELARIDLTPGFVVALKGERALVISNLDDMRRKQFPYIGRPLFYVDELGCLRAFRTVIREAGAPSVKELSDDQGSSGLSRYLAFTNTLIPVFNRAHAAKNSGQAEANGVQALLALKVYKARFGRYPDTLSQVSSALGWVLRDDPFSGKSLGYKRIGDGCLVYSIGRNLKDDGGVEGKVTVGQDPREHGDIVWRLER